MSLLVTAHYYGSAIASLVTLSGFFLSHNSDVPFVKLLMVFHPHVRAAVVIVRRSVPGSDDAAIIITYPFALSSLPLLSLRLYCSGSGGLFN